MPGQLIPTTDYPRYSQRVKLSGVDYLLKFHWNSRSGRWFLDLYSDEEERIVMGIALTVNRPLFLRHHFDPRVPPGELFVVTTTDDQTAPTLDELGEGKRCELTYYPPEES